MNIKKRINLFLLCGMIMAGGLIFPGNISASEERECQPTRYDVIGPFYRPGAIVRNSIGTGYVLTGRVLSTENCAPLPRARIEIWLVGPEGEYGDEYRATVLPDKDGNYRFECDPPSGYSGRPPHIHIMVSAIGHDRLITQHYPKADSTEATFDLVLEPLAQ